MYSFKERLKTFGECIFWLAVVWGIVGLLSGRFVWAQATRPATRPVVFDAVEFAVDGADYRLGLRSRVGFTPVAWKVDDTAARAAHMVKHSGAVMLDWEPEHFGMDMGKFASAVEADLVRLAGKHPELVLMAWDMPAPYCNVARIKSKVHAAAPQCYWVEGWGPVEWERASRERLVWTRANFNGRVYAVLNVNTILVAADPFHGGNEHPMSYQRCVVMADAMVRFWREGLVDGFIWWGWSPWRDARAAAVYEKATKAALGE